MPNPESTDIDNMSEEKHPEAGADAPDTSGTPDAAYSPTNSELHPAMLKELAEILDSGKANPQSGPQSPEVATVARITRRGRFAIYVAYEDSDKAS